MSVFSQRAPSWLLWSLAVAVVLLDWITKRWALVHLSQREPLDLLGEFLRLSFTRNTGVAFGLFADLELPLGWVSLAALAIVFWLALRSGTKDSSRAVSLGLILGGAAGNLIDRVRWGSVVDFIDVGLGALRWPVFNVADSAITIGVCLWALRLFLPHPTPATRDTLSDVETASHGGGA